MIIAIKSSYPMMWDKLFICWGCFRVHWAYGVIRLEGCIDYYRATGCYTEGPINDTLAKLRNEKGGDEKCDIVT